MPDITYHGSSEGGTFEVFYLMADGDSDGQNRRPVLEVLVDRDDKIWIAAVQSPYVPAVSTLPQVTNGTVHRHTDEDLEAAGVDSACVCLGAVMAYVFPRIATLMARVYCPAKPAIVDSLGSEK